MGEAAGSRFRRATWVNVVGNAAKIVVEAAAGLTFGSVALVADAAHSVADLIASVVVLIWGGAGYEVADSDHPHGHERFEPVTALVVGGTIGVMGLWLLVESLRGIYIGTDVTFSYVLVVALGFAIAIMAFVARYTARINESLDSTALRALVVDSQNDIYSSFAALAGVLGVWSGVPILDPIAGGIVSLLVIHQGIQVARENLSYLVGSAPPSEKRDAVRRALHDHPDVCGVHDLVVYYEGTALEVEAHVEVDGEMTLHEAHGLESDLVDRLLDIDEIRDAHVHLDPGGLGEWKDADEPAAIR